MGAAAATESFIRSWTQRRSRHGASSTTSATRLDSSYLTFASVPGNFLADISILKLDGDILKSEVYTYNAANELTTQALDSYTVNYAYDQFGRMTQVVRRQRRIIRTTGINLGCGPATGDQKRRSRDGGGAMTKYRVDQGYGVVNEEDSGGTLLTTYIHHPGRQIGTVLATSEGSTASSGTWAYYFQDAIGSTRGLWDDDGARLGKYDYTPFGGKLGESGVEITRKFTGHDWDNEARLYHTAYRQYSPDSGRWLTRDPLGMVDGPNVYAYVVNNPVTMVDPDGRAIAAVAILLVFFVVSHLAMCLHIAHELSHIGPAEHTYYARHCVMGCELAKCAGWLYGGPHAAHAYNWLYEWWGGRGLIELFTSSSARDSTSDEDDYAAWWGAKYASQSPCDDCHVLCVLRFPDTWSLP